MSTPNKTVLWQAILNLEAALGRLGGGGPDTGDATQATLVYQPGGVAAKNVYTTWPTLYAALNAAAPTSANGTRSPVTIQVDDSFVSPAVVPVGAYNLDNVALTGVANFNGDGGAAILNFADGASLVLPAAGTILKISRGLMVQTLGTVVPLITVTGATQEVNVYIDNGACLLSLGAAPFLLVSNGFGWIQCTTSEQIGDGVHAIAHLAGGGLTLDAFGNSPIFANAVTGAGAVVAWDGTIPGAQGAGVVISQFNGYVPAVPGNWSPVPNAQSQALDQLAARTPLLPTVAVVTGLNTPYTALPTDGLIEVESAGAFRQVNFEAAPSTGQRHTVKWWSYAGAGDPPPQVNGNGKQVESISGPNASLGLTGLAASTNIVTPGGFAMWEYDGTQWVLVG